MDDNQELRDRLKRVEDQLDLVSELLSGQIAQNQAIGNTLTGLLQAVGHVPEVREAVLTQFRLAQEIRAEISTSKAADQAYGELVQLFSVAMAEAAEASVEPIVEARPADGVLH